MSHTTSPPRLCSLLLQAVIDVRDREYVLGDLAEEYGRVLERRGERAAKRWYRGETVRALLPALRRRMGRDARAMETPMDGTKRMQARLSGWSTDARLAWRSLTRRPAFMLIAVLTLGLAIGSNAATFGVVDAVLLRPMPYPGADRIVSVSELHAERLREPGWASIPNYLDWREQAKSFERVSVFRGRSMAVTGGGDAMYVYGAYVSPAFFETFGVSAGRGRALAEGDDVAQGGAVAVLSHGFWMRRFGGDASVIGRTMIVDGLAREIVGVMPAGFNAPGEWIGADVRMDLWIPLVIDPGQYSRGGRSYNVVARLRPDVTLEDARLEMQLIGDRLAGAWPESNEGWDVRVLSWKEMVVGYTRSLLFPLWGAMGLLLLVACANVGNLMLNRALARRVEYATRAALGAGGGRLARPALIESAGIGLAGAALGVVVSWLLLSVVRVLDPGDLPRLSEAGVDMRVLLVTAAVGLAVSIVLAVVPALRSSRANAQEALRASTRVGGVSRGASRMRDAMAVLQLALALALLAGSALVVRGFLRMRANSPGFEPAGVLVATVALSWDRVPGIERRSAFTAAVLDRLRAIPGVESAAMINSLPFSGSHQQQTFAIDGVATSEESEPFAALRGVSPGYVATMQIPLRGREFTEADLAGPTRVVLVNDALARRYMGGADPIARRLVLFNGDVTAEIVGVVGDVRHYGLDRSAMPEIYFPYTADQLTSKSYVVRTDGDPAVLAPAVRAAIHEVDPAQPLRAAGPERAETVPLEEMIDASLAGARFRTLVLVLLSGIALALSAVGLFAVVAVTVTERRHEIGVRMALGAERRGVLLWILARSARLATVAFLAGLLLVFVAGRTMEALLFGASARDPAALGVAVAAFVTITLIAVVAPAIRAMRVEPARVLRLD